MLSRCSSTSLRLVTLRPWSSNCLQLLMSTMSSSQQEPAYFVSKNLPLKYFEGRKSLSSRYALDMWEKDGDVPRKDLLERVKGKHGLFCTLVDRIDREVLEAAGNQLKVVSTLSVGYDHIDVEECMRRGIKVGNTPDVLTDSVAELTIALLLATSRRLLQANRALHDGRWLPGWNHFGMCGRDIKNSVIGFIGLGRIGQSVLQRLKAFEPREVLYTARHRNMPVEAKYGTRYASLDELLGASDFVIVLCSLSDSTRHLLGKEQFKLMKKSAILINTSRGAVVDQPALVEALKDGEIGMAGLDVMEVEPLPRGDPLAKLDNVVLLPHIGSATISTREAMIDLALANLEAGMDQRALPAAIVK